MLSAVLVAAGSGVRFGGEKILARAGGRPLLHLCLQRLARVPGLAEIVVVLPAGRLEAIRAEHGAALTALGATRFAAGGARRQDSVEAGVLACDPAADLILVHDAVRPLFSVDAAAEAVRAAAEVGAAIVAVPARDTLKRVDSERRIVETVPREGVWHAETPQVFRRDVLERSFERARADGFTGTDEASLVEHAGLPVAVVRGGVWNVKVTEPADLDLVARLLEAEES